jgi:tetratricopeptide (TPR) repeat protein
MKKGFLLALLAASLFFTPGAYAQITMPQPSPSATVTQKVGLADVTLSYSRPSARGRKIFGDLLPYGQLWRTGANAATKLTFSDEVTVNGTKVPAGEYSLFTIPGKDEWTVMLNKNAKASANDYKEAEDVARFKVKSAKTAAPYETFTIDFSDLTPNAASMNIKWENTKVALKLETDVDSKVMAQIKELVIDSPNAKPQDLYAASIYYMENNKDLNQALTWMNKATEKDPQFWQLHQKARLQAKLKDYKNAEATARKSIELAKTAKNDDYVRLNEKLLAELPKAK